MGIFIKKATFVVGIARKGLVLCMFFIGVSLSADVLKTVGVKPLIQGMMLGLVISIAVLV